MFLLLFFIVFLTNYNKPTGIRGEPSTAIDAPPPSPRSPERQGGTLDDDPPHDRQATGHTANSEPPAVKERPQRRQPPATSDGEAPAARRRSHQRWTPPSSDREPPARKTPHQRRRGPSGDGHPPPATEKPQRRGGGPIGNGKPPTSDGEAPAARETPAAGGRPKRRGGLNDDGCPPVVGERSLRPIATPRQHGPSCRHRLHPLSFHMRCISSDPVNT
jgi:hypothetical protein